MNNMLIVFLAIFNTVYSAQWNYSDPNTWPYLEDNQYASCGSNLQSPIYISANNVIFDRTMQPIQLANYDNYLSFNFTNAALTIIAQLQIQPSDYSLLYTGSGLSLMKAPFKFAQFHFHWSTSTSNGSEHIINNFGAPLELHLVHRSIKDPDYFAVIGILFKLSKNDNPNLTGIIEAANFVATYPNASIIRPVNLKKLLPDDLSGYYYYEGSLTTPPCSERVYWTVLDQRVEISEQQLNQFLSNSVKSNVRAPQPLNGRLVRTFKTSLSFNKVCTVHRNMVSNIFKLITQVFITIFLYKY